MRWHEMRWCPSAACRELDHPVPPCKRALLLLLSSGVRPMGAICNFIIILFFSTEDYPYPASVVMCYLLHRWNKNTNNTPTAATAANNNSNNSNSEQLFCALVFSCPRICTSILKQNRLLVQSKSELCTWVQQQQNQVFVTHWAAGKCYGVLYVKSSFFVMFVFLCWISLSERELLTQVRLAISGF